MRGIVCFRITSLVPLVVTRTAQLAGAVATTVVGTSNKKYFCVGTRQLNILSAIIRT